MRSIDVQPLVDTATLGRFHYKVLFWCALIIVFDGYDLAVAGIALPAIMRDMSLDPARAGLLVSAALFGMMFGNVVVGTVSDRVGRKRTIAACITLFSVFTALAGLSAEPWQFAISRFLAGIGIGGVMPNVIAQMTDFAPKRTRSMMVTLMFSGYSLGGMLAASLGKAMIERFGWSSLFLAAGLPILLLPIIVRTMPESLVFLARQGRHADIRATLAQIEPAYRPMESDILLQGATLSQKVERASIRQLFEDGRGMSTIMFWVSCFMCLFMVYALSSWLAKLMAGAGYSLGSALTFVLVLNLGGMIGAIGGGWLADKLHIKYVLAFMYVLAAISISLLGFKVEQTWLYLLVGLAGASTIGTQIVGCAYAGQFYPAEIRATGVGWTLGVGRSGAIIAPILIGIFMEMALPIQQNFLLIGVPGLIAACAVMAIRHHRSATVIADQLVRDTPATVQNAASA